MIEACIVVTESLTLSGDAGAGGLVGGARFVEKRGAYNNIERN